MSLEKRERLLDLMASSIRANLLASSCAAVTIKAWNAVVDGRPLRFLQWRTDERFPTVAIAGQR